MGNLTHERGVEWAAERLEAEVVVPGAYHLRDGQGRRIRVAARHIKNRQPNYFHLGDTLAGSPFDGIAVVLFKPDWSVSYAYLLPLEVVLRHHKQPGVQKPRLMIRGDDSWREDPSVEALA